MSNFRKLSLYQFFKNHSRGVHHLASSKADNPMFLCKESKELYRAFLRGIKSKSKYFLITENTKKRISNIPTADIKGGRVFQLIEKAGETGIVSFENNLHFAYAITKAGIHIAVSKKIYRKTFEKWFELYNTVLGYIYIDFHSDSLEYWINNWLDVTRQGENHRNILFEDAHIIKEFKSLQRKGMLNDEYARTLDSDYQNKFNETRLCLQAFMFIHFAKVIDVTRFTEDSSTLNKFKNIKEQSINVIRVDTFYDTNIKVINPFSVTGHFRNQPIGEGRKEKRLIYIDSFMKTGYTRTATKIKENI